MVEPFWMRQWEKKQSILLKFSREYSFLVSISTCFSRWNIQKLEFAFSYSSTSSFQYFSKFKMP